MHTLRGVSTQLCSDFSGRREQAPKSQSAPATELCCFWFVRLLENKRHYRLRRWEIREEANENHVSFLELTICRK